MTESHGCGADNQPYVSSGWVALIAPEHDYTTCSDNDLCNKDRICVRCHMLAVERGEREPYQYALIIDKRRADD